MGYRRQSLRRTRLSITRRKIPRQSSRVLRHDHLARSTHLCPTHAGAYRFGLHRSQDGYWYRTLDADTAGRAIEIDKGLTTDAFRVLDSLAIHENTQTLERILNVIRNKGSITTSKLQNSHNFKAAEIEEFKKAIEAKKVEGVRVEEGTASNNKTQTTYIAT